jgi:hypothetical protein
MPLKHGMIVIDGVPRWYYNNKLVAIENKDNGQPQIAIDSNENSRRSNQPPQENKLFTNVQAKAEEKISN